MSEDRPLTEFSSTEPTTDGADTVDREIESVDSDETNTTIDREPATITYRWQPGGAVCAACGAATETQWLDGDEFVCPDCKSWE